MTETGRAAVFNGTGNPFEIREYPLPELEPGAILIRVTMATICGSDIHIWKGEIDLAAIGVGLPTIIGHEMTGRVARLGEGVSTDSMGQPLAEGDRVVYRYFRPCGRCPVCLRGEDAACGMNHFLWSSAEEYPHFNGAYAEYYYLKPGQTVIKVPDELTDAMVAPLNCALSEVIYGLERVKLGFGETLVIQGAGGLGINATAVAREMGASRVIVVDGIDDRLALARDFGADEIIDMRQFPTPEERIMRVMELTEYRGADVVAEFVGVPGVIPEGLSMLGQGGRYLEIGNISPGRTFELDPTVLVAGSKSIQAMVFYSAETVRKALDFLSRCKKRYPFDRILARSYPLEEINEAFEAQARGLVSRSAIIP